MTEKTQTQKSTKKSTKTSAKKSTAKKKVLQQVAEPVENNANTVLEVKENDNMNAETINNTINTTAENNDANAIAENNDVNTVTEEKENATMTNETNNNNTTTIDTIDTIDNNTNITTAALKISGITQEQLLQILKNAGVDTTQVNITAKVPKVNDKLTYTDDSKTFAICAANNEHIFNINELDEETRIESMKSGLCPHCLSIMKQATAIKAASGFRTRTVTNNKPSAEKPGFQIREILKANLNNINDELLAQLQDKDFSRSNFKLAYPMLLNITGMSAEEIKVARKDAKQHDRYSPQVYTINRQQFLLTNDLYGKNLEPIANFFNKLA